MALLMEPAALRTAVNVERGCIWKPIVSRSITRIRAPAQKHTWEHCLSSIAVLAVIGTGRKHLRRGRRMGNVLPASVTRWAKVDGASDAKLAATADKKSERSRKVVVEHESSIDFEMIDVSVASMDDFMKENAANAVLQNIQRIEDSPGDADVKFCYLEPNDIGPYRSQMRLTIKVIVEKQQVDIVMLDMEPGNVDKKTGDVTFDPANRPNFKTDNKVTWKSDEAGVLLISNRSVAKTELLLPWWFPVPDMLVERVTGFFIRQVITTGQKKANEQIQAQFAEWAAN